MGIVFIYFIIDKKKQKNITCENITCENINYNIKLPALN